MRRIALTLCLTTTLLPHSATAQSAGDALFQAWSQVPFSTVLDPQASGMDITFHDPAAVRRSGMDLSNEGWDPGMVAVAAVPPAELVEFMSPGLHNWRDLVGIDPAQIEQIVEVSVPPVRAHWYTMASGGTEGVAAVLGARGYESTTIEGVPAHFLGGNDFEPDFRNLQNKDIFTGPVMLAARVATDGNTIVSSSSTPLLSDALDGRGPVLTDQPEIAQLIAALDDVEADGPLLQAFLISEPLQVFVPMGPVETPPVGPWTYGLLAEFSDGITSTGVLALAFVHPVAASQGAVTLEQSWQDHISLMNQEPISAQFTTLPDISVSSVEPRVVLFAVTQTLDPDRAVLFRASPMMRLLNMIWMRDMPFLRPM